MQLLPGQEVTTDHGHANVFGDVGWIDFRRPADDWLIGDRARAAGCSRSTTRWPPTAPGGTRGAAAAARRDLALDLAGPPLGRATGLVAGLGPGGDPVGGSDFHRPGSDSPPGAPTTWVACRRSQLDGGDAAGAVLDGLRAGRVAVSAGAAEPVLLRLGDELVAVGAAGLLVSGPDGRRIQVRGDRTTIPAEPGPRWLKDHDTTIVALTA